MSHSFKVKKIRKPALIAAAAVLRISFSLAADVDPSVIGTIRAPLDDATTLSAEDSRTRPYRPGIDVDVEPDQQNLVVGFTLTNKGSPHTNPTGADTGANREYDFSAPGLARLNEGLTIVETSNPNGKDTETTMMTAIVFIPRRFVPALRVSADGQSAEVILPTGESVLFDANTREIVDGALKETAPIDRSTDRNKRTFAHLAYTGGGIMIRSDQRGDSPKLPVVWGVKKKATITWGSRTCTYPTAAIWNPDDPKNGFQWLTDDAFYGFVNMACGWKVSAADFANLPTPTDSTNSARASSARKHRGTASVKARPDPSKSR